MNLIIFVLIYIVILVAFNLFVSMLNYAFLKKFNNNTKLDFKNCFFLTGFLLHIGTALITLLLFVFDFFWVACWLFYVCFISMIESKLLKKYLYFNEEPLSALIKFNTLCFIISLLLAFLCVDQESVWRLDNSSTIINIIIAIIYGGLFLLISRHSKTIIIPNNSFLKEKTIKHYSGNDLEGKLVKKLITKYCIPYNIKTIFSQEKNGNKVEINDKKLITHLIKNNSIYDVKIENNSDSYCVYIDDLC